MSRFFSAKNILYLFGPRGTGKSTFISRFYDDALYLDMLDPEMKSIS